MPEDDGRADRHTIAEVLVMICRPVDWSVVAELAPDVPEVPILPGSVVQSCAACGIDVYVGPMSQKTAASCSGTLMLCVVCSWRTVNLALGREDLIVNKVLQALKGNGTPDVASS